MNALESYSTTGPYGKVDECAKFMIDNPSIPFVLSDITVAGQQYTFSVWLKSDIEGSLTVADTTFASSADWTKYENNFISEGTDLSFIFGATGTYYLYCAQLELGSVPTDWTPAPEDVDSTLAATDKVATDAKNLAEDNEGRVSSAESSLNSLGEKVDTLMPIGKYIDINLDGTKPYTMELGERGSEMTLRLANSRIQFMDGTFVSAYMSNKKLHIDTAVIENELQIGSFVWIERANGNVGLIWKKGDV